MSWITVVAIVVLALDVVGVVSYVVSCRTWLGYFGVSRERRPWWAR